MTIRLTYPDTEENRAVVAMADPIGSWEEPPVVHAYFDDGSNLEELARGIGGTVAAVVEEDWAENWKKASGPVRVGSFLVLPPWLAPAAPDPWTLIIEPAMAFGTGDHATTRGCLAALERRVRLRDRVLDFGCGSGILGIAARRLGAADVLCVDCDPECVKAADENSRANGVRVETLLSDRPPEGPFDVIVANIQSSVLYPLLDRLRSSLRPNGVLIVSGLLAEEDFPVSALQGVSAMAGWKTIEIGPVA